MYILAIFIHLILVYANTETALIKIDPEWPVQLKTCTNCVTPNEPLQLSLDITPTIPQELWVEFAQFKQGKTYHFKTCWPATYPVKIDISSKTLPPDVSAPMDALLLDKDETDKPRLYLIVSVATDYYLIDGTRDYPLDVPIEIQLNENKMFGLMSVELINLAVKSVFAIGVGFVFRNLVWSVLK